MKICRSRSETTLKNTRNNAKDFSRGLALGFRVVLLLNLLTTCVYASTSANFLRENLNARQSGMGGVYTAAADDSDSTQSNPAGLSLLQRPEINFSYAPTRDTAQHIFFSYAHPIVQKEKFTFSFGAGLSYYSAGNMDVNRGGTSRTVNAETSYAGFFSIGAKISKWLAIGISPKYVRSTLVDQFTGAAFAMDMGAMIFPLPNLFRERIILGAASQNLGSKIKYKSEEQDLPRTESAGIAIKPFEHKEYGTLLTSFQAEKVMGEKWRYRVGSEYALGGEVKERVLFLRGGAKIQFDSEDYTLGVGFRERNLQVDYALVNGISLERTHRFSILFRFGRFVEKRPAVERLIKWEKERGSESY